MCGVIHIIQLQAIKERLHSTYISVQYSHITGYNWIHQWWQNFASSVTHDNFAIHGTEAIEVMGIVFSVIQMPIK